MGVWVLYIILIVPILIIISATVLSNIILIIKLKIFLFPEALSPAFIHTGADLWPHPLNFASAEQLQQLQQQALLGHPALHQQLPVRSFL